jgi:hypothetical protein
MDDLQMQRAAEPGEFKVRPSANAAGTRLNGGFEAVWN